MKYKHSNRGWFLISFQRNCQQLLKVDLKHVYFSILMLKKTRYMYLNFESDKGLRNATI